MYARFPASGLHPDQKQQPAYTSAKCENKKPGPLARDEASKAGEAGTALSYVGPEI